MKDDLIKLAERVEAAEGPDRELDAAIAVTALGMYRDGLSEAERRDILAADADDAYCPHFGRLYQDDLTITLVDAYPAHHDPDCSTDDDGGTRWSFTPLGLAVRAHLEARP